MFRISKVRTLAACAAVISCAGLLLPSAVSASSVDGTLSVSASVAQNCTLTSSATMAFGAYDPVVTNLSAALDKSADLVATCTAGASSIRLDMGASANAGSCAATTRCMKNGSNYLDYELYQDSGHSTVWGSGTGSPGGETLSPSNWGVANPDTVTVYGEIPGGQDAFVSSGNYTDSITATLNF